MLEIMNNKNMDTSENKNIENFYTFYMPGDLVILKHKELRSPIMLVKEKVSKQFKNEAGEISNIFRGMKCIWFDKNNVLQEAIFSTKDLEPYKK